MILDFGLQLLVVVGLIIVMTAVVWGIEKAREPRCTCGPFLWHRCPVHGWEMAEPIGPLAGFLVENILIDYLCEEEHDAAWFEGKIDQRLAECVPDRRWTLDEIAAAVDTTSEQLAHLFPAHS